MNKQLKSVMLIDDNHEDNFFHEREIKKLNPELVVIKANSGFEALDYLKTSKSNGLLHPDLIFLDINMPGMNGWDFLEEYNRFDAQLQSSVIISMLTTSENVEDAVRAKKWSFVSDFVSKALTRETMKLIIQKHFN